LNSEFKNHEEVVERLNSLNLSWKAEVYEEFKDKTIKDLNRLSGRKSKERIKNKSHIKAKNKHETQNNLEENNNLYNGYFSQGFKLKSKIINFVLF